MYSFLLIFLSLHLDAFAIIFATILGFIFVRKIKKKELGVSIQAEIMKDVLEQLAQMKIARPKMINKVNGLENELKSEKDPGQLLNINSKLQTAKTELTNQTQNMIDRLEEGIYKLEVIGSLKIRNWIIGKLSSSLNTLSPWLTDLNMDELIFIIRDELRIIPWREKIRYSLKSWINKR